MRRADFSVQLDRRKPACVLEPALVLAHAPGPALALRLVAVFEPWLTRSFWQAIDASELLLMHGASAASKVNSAALTRWLALRENTDSAGWVLRWVGDRLAESHLLDSADNDIVDRYEHLLAALQARACPRGASAAVHDPWCGFDADQAGMDALALSAALDSALVLCSAGADGLPPLVGLAQKLGITVESPQQWHPGSLFIAERESSRAALARAGLATLVQAMPPLAVLHVWLDEEGERSVPASAADELGPTLTDPWSQARLWWYAL